MGYAGHMGWMWLWWAFGAVILVILVWAAVRAATPTPPAEGAGTAEDILKRRYARGEIGHEEYEQRLHDLRQ